MSTLTVTTWSLEQTSPADVRPATAPEGDVRIVRAEVPSPEFSRFLYASVGGDIRWIDRLGWTYAQWRDHLTRRGVETWVALDRGRPPGTWSWRRRTRVPWRSSTSASSRPSVAGGSAGTCCPRAPPAPGTWRPVAGVSPTKRVWLHTCSKDGEHAMDNYLRRGFTLFDTKVEEEPETSTPDPGLGRTLPDLRRHPTSRPCDRTHL